MMARPRLRPGDRVSVRRCVGLDGRAPAVQLRMRNRIGTVTKVVDRWEVKVLWDGRKSEDGDWIPDFLETTRR